MIALAALQRAAFRSPFNFRHAVLVVSGGRVLSLGYNTYCRHAEVNALSKLWASNRSGVVVYSVRFNRRGQLRMAKPCPACEAYLREYGIKSVVYSDREGQLQEMRL